MCCCDHQGGIGRQESVPEAATCGHHAFYHHQGSVEYMVEVRASTLESLCRPYNLLTGHSIRPVWLP